MWQGRVCHVWQWLGGVFKLPSKTVPGMWRIAVRLVLLVPEVLTLPTCEVVFYLAKTIIHHGNTNR